MGRPKGLCRLSPQAPTFIAAIAALYRAPGWRLAVVTTAALVEVYAPELRGRTVKWIARSSGQGPAASVWAACEELRREATHLWLHPVDLPSVGFATVLALLRVSRAAPSAVLVPMHHGVPGHPVVLPTAAAELLRERRLDGKLRPHLLDLAEGPASSRRLKLQAIDVPDSGVIEDHDFPSGGAQGRGREGG